MARYVWLRYLPRLLLNRITLSRAMTEMTLEGLAKKVILSNASNANQQVLLAGGMQSSGSEWVLVKYLGPQARVITANIDGLSHIRADLSHAWPFQDGIFDFVISTWVLEHVREPQIFLHEACRVLKDAGILILAVPFIHRIHGSPFDYWRFTDTALRELAECAGFRRTDIIRVGGSPFLCAVSLLWPIFRIPLIGALLALIAALGDSILFVVTRSLGKGLELVKSYPNSFVVVAFK